MSRQTVPMPVTVSDDVLRRLLEHAEKAVSLLDILNGFAPDEPTYAATEYTARDLRRAVEAVRAELDPRK